jgi:hypothetical protein
MQGYDIDGRDAAAPKARAHRCADGRPTASASAESGGVVALQRAAGNQAVAGALQRDDDEAAAGDQVRGVLRSGGQPLETGFRSRAESFLGADLGHVRVHNDGAAAQAAAAVRSHAYTSGSDIVFGAGKYDTGSAEGQHRLAHELTHVVQQSKGSVDGTMTAGRLKISDPSDRFEREADCSAAAFVSGKAGASPASGGAAGVQREAESGEAEEEALQMQAIQREEDGEEEEVQEQAIQRQEEGDEAEDEDI